MSNELVITYEGAMPVKAELPGGSRSGHKRVAKLCGGQWRRAIPEGRVINIKKELERSVFFETSVELMTV